MPTKIPVTVLGATGVVGQRFVARLAQHPWFELVHLAASERSVGKRYSEACTWRVPGGQPFAGCGERELRACDESVATRVVFSALDAPVARELEPRFARAGALVFSNASAFRMEADVPLLVPEVNADSLQLLEVQRERRGWSGAIVCNPNCTAAVLVTALQPLHERFGVEDVLMTSMQAVSGAGYPGVASLDALGNVVPFIRDEEHKVELELAKMLGRMRGRAVEPAALRVSALCHRVPVLDGHSESVALRLSGAPSCAAVSEALATWRAEPQLRGLPSAPPHPVVVHTAEDRPQPRLDVERDAGMSVHVGRIRPCAILGLKMFVLGHNLERGAAGGSVLNAELLLARGMLAS
ncbi:MAG: aspartate-semialdehyde dehydrogenase [Planctomycetes bacterium]|nr:aspartate-semialdehyde dehydrogenase [Planctomycetota bacterium]